MDALRINALIGHFQGFRSEDVFVLKYTNTSGTEILLPFRCVSEDMKKGLDNLKPDAIIGLQYEFDKLSSGSVCMNAKKISVLSTGMKGEPDEDE